jgi:peroxiredoxin Q/BCP
MKIMELEKGQKAPDFSLPAVSGKTVSLKDYKGKWVIVYFYPKDNTPGCTIEAKEFTDSISEFTKLGTDILGISADTPESHIKFAKKHELKLKLLSDVEKKALVAYGAWGIKKMYGKEYWGIIRSTFLVNPEGNIARAWYNVKVKGHVAEIKKTIEELSQKKS